MLREGKPRPQLDWTKGHVAALLDRSQHFVCFERRAAGSLEIAFERSGYGAVQAAQLTYDPDQFLFCRDRSGPVADPTDRGNVSHDDGTSISRRIGRRPPGSMAA
jgi:hypothetical protein